MSITAPITPVWKKQKLLFSIFLFLFGGYFFLDGAIVWPRSNERYRRHAEFMEKEDKNGWIAYAKEKGWKAEPPEKLYTDSAIAGQFVVGGVLIMGALVSLAYWAANRGRSLRLDDEAVYGPTGVKVPLPAITGLGLKKWEAKGYARVRYSMEGKTGEFIIDDYKYEPDPCKEIVEAIKKHLEARASTGA